MNETTPIGPAMAVAPAPAPKRPRGRPRKLSDKAPTDASVVVKKPVVPRMARKPVAIVPSAIPATSVTPLNYVLTVGRRKRAIARVFIYKNGKGEIEINGKALAAYFPAVALQEMVRLPLELSAFKNSVRVVVRAFGGGLLGQAGAVRLGITRGLLKMDEGLRTMFRARGLLTRDSREKERKKPGLKRARKGPQWAKR